MTQRSYKILSNNCYPLTHTLPLCSRRDNDSKSKFSVSAREPELKDGTTQSSPPPSLLLSFVSSPTQILRQTSPLSLSLWGVQKLLGLLLARCLSTVGSQETARARKRFAHHRSWRPLRVKRCTKFVITVRTMLVPKFASRTSVSSTQRKVAPVERNMPSAALTGWFSQVLIFSLVT